MAETPLDLLFPLVFGPTVFAMAGLGGGPTSTASDIATAAARFMGYVLLQTHAGYGAARVVMI